MLAASITTPCKIDLVELPEPQLSFDRPGEIIFQPEITCLCGSDLPFFTMNGEWPVTVGHSLHEMIGTVVETNGKRWKPGDRVLAVPINQEGFFERFTLSEERAIAVDPRVAEEQALMAQPLGTALFALKKLPNLLDTDVAVVGAGPMGQLFCAAVRNKGARRIIAIDRLEDRLKVSPKMGATHTVCNGAEVSSPVSSQGFPKSLGTENTVEAVRDILQGGLPEIVIEAVGHQDIALNLCFDLVAEHGRILSFGVPAETVDGLRWRELFFKNATVHTSVNPDFRRDFPLAMQWIGEGRIDVTPILTHRFPLAEIQAAFELFHRRRDGALKVLVDFPAGSSAESRNSGGAQHSLRISKTGNEPRPSGSGHGG